ncbi:MAG: zinc ribbon domain-containing protein [Nitrospinota bacterium]
MPIYEYACNRCEHLFERLVGVTAGGGAAEGMECPSCGSREVRRRLSRFGVGSKAGGSMGGGGPSASCCGGICSCR